MFGFCYYFAYKKRRIKLIYKICEEKSCVKVESLSVLDVLIPRYRH